MKPGKIRKISFDNWSDFNEKTKTRKVDLKIGGKKCGRLKVTSEQFMFLNDIVASGILNAYDRE